MMLFITIGINDLKAEFVNTSTNESRLQSAELFYHQLETGYVEIHLIQSYSNKKKGSSDAESVFIHEKDENLPPQITLLDLSKNYEVEQQSKCGVTTKSYIYEYVKKVYLTLNEDGFDLTWSYNTGSQVFNNLEPVPNIGFSLHCKITDPWHTEPNQAPRFDYTNETTYCINEEYSNSLNILDEDEDKVTIQLDEANSIESKNASPSNTKRDRFSIVETGAIISNRPPYKKLQVVDQESSMTSSQSNIIQIDENNKSIKISSEVGGNYLVNFKISDYKNDELVSSHSLVKIFEFNYN